MTWFSLLLYLKKIIKAGTYFFSEAADMTTVKHLKVGPVPTVNMRNMMYHTTLLPTRIFKVIIPKAVLHLIMGDRLPMIISFRQFMKETQPFCFNMYQR